MCVYLEHALSDARLQCRWWPVQIRHNPPSTATFRGGRRLFSLANEESGERSQFLVMACSQRNIKTILKFQPIPVVFRDLTIVKRTQFCERSQFRRAAGTGGRPPGWWGGVSKLDSPAPERSSPVEAGAEAGGQEKVAAVDSTVAIDLVEGDRNRTCRCIAVTLQDS